MTAKLEKDFAQVSGCCGRDDSYGMRCTSLKRLATREKGAYPQRSVTDEQRRQALQGEQPEGVARGSFALRLCRSLVT